ncbi:methyl-accepting chemotaxis protein [Bosea sp. Leaf344]|uniref:methyl-accepting chemotaxis protein n=1 Tax=Bosea sp. Leaf344 TaxID=1736346 RepID=UPI0006FF725B|nr:methyl-accepting chemotaxis protein [Bosea sp. Leaf344]
MTTTIDSLRGLGARLTVAAIWMIGLVVLATVALGETARPAGLGLAALALAAAVTASWWFSEEGIPSRVTQAMGLMIAVSLLVAALAGDAWQIDMHMAYFAALAMLIVFCDWRVIAAATAVVATHHLLLSLLIPAAVFPGSADLGRVVLHAAILLVEAVTLAWAARTIERTLAASAASLAKAQAALAEAATAQRAAETALASADQARASEARAARDNDALQQAVEAERAAVVAGLAEGLEQLALGNLTHRITTRFPADYENLRGDFNRSVSQLEEAMSGIATAAQSIRTAGVEINSGSLDLAGRTETQAVSLQETAATTEQLAASVKLATDGSRHAATLARRAAEIANEGGVIVGSAVAAMKQIEDSSRKISEITDIIEDIAFQTNLLALNAAVEAARAGDAGKGFAVVAAEVRVLAQRSSEAAKDIGQLISSSNQQIVDGVKLVHASGETLGQIVTASGAVTTTVVDVSSASVEQSRGIEEMSRTVARLDEMTQQNAALAEQSSASCLALTSQIEALNGLVRAFRTSSSARQDGAAARPLRSAA